jgi:hypothetical protein
MQSTTHANSFTKFKTFHCTYPNPQNHSWVYEPTRIQALHVTKHILDRHFAKNKDSSLIWGNTVRELIIMLININT